MRTTHRALAATAGALLLSGLLPFQSALADDKLPKLWNFCTNGSGGSLFDPAETPVKVPGGEDAGSACWINFTSPDSGKNWTGTDLRLALPAETVAASGYSAQQLAQMLLVRTNFSATEFGEDWTVRRWTVHRDGAMTVRIPACTNNCTGVFLQLSGAPREGGAELKAQLQATGSGYDPTPMPITFDYYGRAGTKPVTFGTPGTFVPVTPNRLLDTRSGVGAPAAKVGSGRSVNLKVAGRAGVPAAGVTAVVLNVTATNPTAGSFVTAHPHGAARPTASNLNFTAGRTVPNQVTVPVGADGTVDLYNHSGTVDLIADISGYYLEGDSGLRFTGVSPKRLMDTRNPWLNPGTPERPFGPVGSGGTITLDVAGKYPGARAVTLNVTATNPTASSFVTAYPHGAARPTASNLNFTAGQTVPNQVTVPVGADGKVEFYNHSGTVGLVADISGYYSDTGAKFVPTGPTRVLDTREAPGKPLGEHKELDIQPNSWKHGIPPFGVTGVTMNVTATNGTAGSHLSAAPSSGCDRYQGMWPEYSNLNFTAGQTIANAVTGQVPELNYCGGYVWADAVTIYNHEGSVDVVADVSGYFLQD
ncbi:hypothetical protein OG444_18065 [Streptomyces sp. NBC_01232]|uniref:hypothetical protein n=1 Tax=Streptomyces sp. NBC_01232 TaxID=2903786 RepID=UPI002E103C21|nr:hypothetical protein OG444_18065 [Streptomyces sp. NBC_01232]